MKLKKYFVILVILQILLGLMYVTNNVNAEAEEYEYVYYAYAPTEGVLNITGIYDNTHFEIYNLETKEVIAKGKLNKMELFMYSFSEPTYFKIISDKPIVAWIARSNRHFITFYPSVNGWYIGKEFIFMTTPSWWNPEIYLHLPEFYFIFSIERSHVIIYDDKGRKVYEFDISENSYKIIKLKTYKFYHVKSTGNIMIMAPSEASFKYLPSLTGGFIGKHFFGITTGDIWAGDRESFVVLPQESECIVEIFNLKRPSWHIFLSLSIFTGVLAFILYT